MNRDYALLLTMIEYIKRLELYIDGYTIKDFSDDLKTYYASCMVFTANMRMLIKVEGENMFR